MKQTASILVTLFCLRPLVGFAEPATRDHAYLGERRDGAISPDPGRDIVCVEVREPGAEDGFGRQVDRPAVCFPDAETDDSLPRRSAVISPRGDEPKER